MLKAEALYYFFSLDIKLYRAFLTPDFKNLRLWFLIFTSLGSLWAGGSCHICCATCVWKVKKFGKWLTWQICSLFLQHVSACMLWSWQSETAFHHCISQDVHLLSLCLA